MSAIARPLETRPTVGRAGPSWASGPTVCQRSICCDQSTAFVELDVVRCELAPFYVLPPVVALMLRTIHLRAHGGAPAFGEEVAHHRRSTRNDREASEKTNLLPCR